MRIDQRNSGASVAANNGYTLDRWAALNSTAPSFTIQQNAGSVTPPAGFTNYLGCTVVSPVTPGAGQRWSIQQSIEGFNTADLAWGTADARAVTFSFWVRSSLTGVFGGAIRNSAGNRAYPFTYSISAANTWEQKTVTVAGDTTGTWLTNNGIGLALVFSLGAGSTLSGTAGAWAGSDLWSATGSTNVIATNGATLYVTGVQLEVGSKSSAFERRPYGMELGMAMRYYQRYDFATNLRAFMLVGRSSSDANGYLKYPTMRATPIAATSGTFIANLPGLGGITFSAMGCSPATDGGVVFGSGGSALSVGYPAELIGGVLQLNAEL
jgi:hypothetical protein